MRLATTTLALASCLLGCQLVAHEPVRLLTGVNGCYAGGETGMKGRLVVDRDYGTRFNAVPVMWPVGFTAVRVGSEVEVLDTAGKVIATTGREYYISRGYVSSPEGARLESIGAFPAAANCGYPWDFVECSPPAPPSTYCEAASSLRRTSGARL